MKIDKLKSLLETQFGPYIRQSDYQSAFNRTLELFNSLESKPNTEQDNFYLFLHLLVLDLFDEIERLKQEIHELKLSSAE